ncbi:MAG TPA: alpha/beta hydrolase [Galbitalea sp.]
MLFDVAALLITSAALGPAAEAPVEPATTQISQVIDLPVYGAPSNSHSVVPIDPAAIGHPVSISMFRVTGVSDASLETLSGMDLLRELSVLPSTQVASYLSSHPSVVTDLIAHPPAVQQVNDWWTGLTASEQDVLTITAPRLVGNLDGLPVTVRDRSNRAWVSQSISSLGTSISGADGRAIAQNDQHSLHMLKQIEAALKQPKAKSAPKRSLLEVDASGSGKAAIVLGNLQTADYVTYMVPGMFFTVDGQMGDWTGDAADLYAQQVTWLHKLGKVDPDDRGKTVAVVSWMGYQTPDLTNVGSLDLAYKGRDELAHAVQGLQALRAADEPYTTIVAHSYGSTAALMALTEYNFRVDALVLVGTPGSAAQSVDALHVRNHNVFVGAAAWDPVPASAYFGSDPSSPSYGAKVLGVGGAVDPITGKHLGASIGHNGYFDVGSESIRNMALIGIDHPELAMTGSAKDKTRTLSLEH